jgi:hypothetical protein
MVFDRYISTADAFGPDRMARLLALGPIFEPLRRLTERAAIMEMESQRLSPLQYFGLLRSKGGDPDENWACIQLSDGTWLCVDEVSRHVTDANSIQAVLYPQLHMQLISWWLMHAWRCVELTTSCAENLDAWNLNVATILTRSLIEEVGCLLFEAKAISECWSQMKLLPTDDRPLTIRKTLHPILVQFKLGNRGLGGFAAADAPNVLTYVDKLKKQSRLEHLREQYDWLSNAAHPAIGSRMVYMGQPALHESGAVDQWRLSRRPTSMQGRTEDLEFLMPHIAVDALTSTAPIGCDLLWQSLRVVDDFGLTTKAYRLTERVYWRKLRPVSSAPQCPCGCGKWARNQHKWGRPVQTISIAPE